MPSPSIWFARKPLLWALAGSLLLVTSGCAVWRIGQSAELARASQPLQQAPANATVRLLIVGDSTAVGTGASSPQHSLAGLLARDHPRLLIDNRARDGAKLADVVTQLAAGGRYDIVLVQAGGNDVIRFTSAENLQAAVDAIAVGARQSGGLVLWMPSGNVGNAPFFFAPWSWWMTQRSRALHRTVQASAARSGAVYVNLFHESVDDPFVKSRALNASDGLHPSDAGYLVWFSELMDQGGLSARLAPAKANGTTATGRTALAAQ
jgi:lysophospholipase L1-like esterase